MKVKLLDQDTIGIFFTYDQRVVSLVRSIAGVRYEPGARFWYFTISGIASQEVARLQQAGFEVEQGVIDRLAEFALVINDLNASKFQSDLPLYPFQAETAQFMVRTGNALNANFVGSGKTLTSLAVVRALKAKSTLIIAPKSVVLQWATIEIPKWLPRAKVLAIVGDKKERTKLYHELFDNFVKYDFVVVGYETARIDVALFARFKWGVTICDEAHRLANTTTKLYKALKLIESQHRFGLTATPVMNAPQDLYGVINWIKPNALGSWFQFMKRYIVKDQWGSPKYYMNLEELAERVKPFIIKKTLAEVGMQLPPYVEEIIPVELSAKERKNYDLMKAEMLRDIEPSILSKLESPVILQNAIVKLGKLFEVCDSLELLGEHTESSKIEVLKEHLETTVINGQKIIIITRFARMAKILERVLSEYHPLLITGQTINRAEILKWFETLDRHRILIGTEAIGQGLNLQRANVLYNFDLAWNPARMKQRAGRIYRNLQEKPVFVYNLVCTKSVEGWLQKKLVDKQEISDRLLPNSLVAIKEMLTE